MAAAKAAYWRIPDEDELRGTGFVPTDYELDDVEVWPENWQAWTLFTDMRTQWRVGFSGRTGLDYTPMFALMDRMHLSDDDWRELFDDVKVLEASAMRAVRESAPTPRSR